MYRTEPLFPYANDYFGIFPKGFENREIGKGSIFVADEYVIYFKPNTPEDIKRRLIKDYAEYHAKQKATGLY